MKTIKIFLASSEELDYDRMVFGNLVRRLDDMYEKRGIRIKLFEWEDYDAAFNDRRKQDEYNDHVRESDIFFALFHKKAGKFTIEEFDIASEEFKQHASPKVFTFCKDLQPGEEESPELAEFKKRLFGEMGHYWSRYDSRESLQLQFVMQLQLVESNQMSQLKVEDGNVTMDGIRIAPMDKLRFAAANEDYQKMQTEMFELHEEIEEMQLNLEKKQQKLEKKKAKLEKDPDDEEYQEEYHEVKEEVDDLVDKLQPRLNKYNKLKEDFGEYQKLLFDTAKRVAQLQGERITERMRRAMDAFSEGKVREANIILDEAEADARRNLEDYKQSKEITELKRQAVISSIEELQLKASTVMADASIPIEERVAQTEEIYAQADEMAKEVEYDGEKYAKLLMEYGGFLYEHGQYDKALSLYLRQVFLLESVHNKNHYEIAVSYNNIGLVYYSQYDYQKALDYYNRSSAILKSELGERHPMIATVYNNIGGIYENIDAFSKASEFYNKSLDICEKMLGKKHSYTAVVLNNIGSLFSKQNNYFKALDYCKKAFSIWKEIYGEDHPDIATAYNNIGSIYDDLGDQLKAIEYYNKALAIFQKTIGLEHPSTINVYLNIGSIYDDIIGDYSKALKYYENAFAIMERTYKENEETFALKNIIEELKQKHYQKTNNHNGTQSLYSQISKK